MSIKLLGVSIRVEGANIMYGSSFGTEHLGSLLLDMGFNAAPRVLDQALDDMDPDATGEISKVMFRLNRMPTTNASLTW